MTIDFYTAHLETLSDLKTLADKHNCKIQFGIRSNAMQLDDIDQDYFIKHFKCPEDIAKEICDSNLCSFEHFNSGQSFCIYFELIDCNDENHPKYNILSKTICENSFKVNVHEYNFLPEHELSEKALQWLQETSMNDEWGYPDYNDFIMIDDYESEEVHGFEGVTKDGWCYRTGMILAVFAQLVCDYLGEERIKRCY